MDFSGILGAEIAQRKASRRKNIKGNGPSSKIARGISQNDALEARQLTDVPSTSEPISAGKMGTEAGKESSKSGAQDEIKSLESAKEVVLQTGSLYESGKSGPANPTVPESPEQHLAGRLQKHVTPRKSIEGIDQELRLLATKDLSDSEKAQFQLLRQERIQLQLKSQQSLEETVPFLIEVQDIFKKPQPRERLHLQIRKYLKYLVKEWEKLSENSKDKQLLRETKRDLIVVLNLLRRYQLLESILVSLCTVLYHVQRAQFGHANESYMQLSIGNTVWPIGVRNVGIHQRAADQKITGDDKSTRANIMIDDATRRWITAVKRLITFTEKNPLVVTCE